ncbi:2Fe-2S iron-sulfur cluster-binding protein [Streptomyces blattellae]|uniref:2Fe-2S iron-sulfur cluster-binding protein n=1 Tax=Streptomyces blattellae TaxID=2569855 RepID=UPI0038B44C96
MFWPRDGGSTALCRHRIGTVGGAPAFACSPGHSVLDAANAVGVALPQSCGEGACGTCRARVLSGTYEADDRGMFSADELAAGRGSPAALGVSPLERSCRDYRCRPWSFLIVCFAFPVSNYP